MADIANGTYRARAVSWGLGEASTGTEEIAIEFVIKDVEGVEGPHITWHGYFTEKGLPHTLKALRACGWQGDMLTDLNGLDTNDVSLVIENEAYEGKVYPKVRWVNPIGGGGLGLKAPMDDSKAKAFAARMRQQIVALEAGEGQRPKPQARPVARRTAALPPEPPPHGDEDIPF